MFILGRAALKAYKRAKRYPECPRCGSVTGKPGLFNKAIMKMADRDGTLGSYDDYRVCSNRWCSQIYHKDELT